MQYSVLHGQITQNRVMTEQDFSQRMVQSHRLAVIIIAGKLENNDFRLMEC